MSNETIVKKASEHVFQLFKDCLPDWAVYHNYDQTVETAEAAEEFAQNSRLSKPDAELVALAAWFGDAGIAASGDDTGTKSVEIATAFLKQQEYPEDRIAKVAEGIRSMKSHAAPRSVLEEILHDADIIHIGKKKFFKKNDLLRTELELRTGKPVSDVEWLTMSVDFVSKNSFRTKYAQMEYARQRTKNLIELQEQLRDAADQHQQKEKKNTEKQEKEKIPVRGIETMLRMMSGNHIHFSSIADHKASMLISTNSLMMTLIVTLYGRGLFEKDPTTLTSVYPRYVIVPIVVLMISALLTIIFAILSTKPKITTGTFTKEDIRAKRANLLFFGNFFNMPVEDYEWGIREMMKDGEYLYGTMIRDIFSLGKVVAKKFEYLRISYLVFMTGLIATIASFILMYLFS